MYLAYEPISKKPDSSAFVPPELFEAQKQAKASIPSKITKIWDQWIADHLKFTQEELWNVFSSEQIDSIGLIIYNFLEGRNFIIGDETGIGKGRILSAVCRWAILNDKKILFFTEREHLFTDFWRDLIDTQTLPLLVKPVVFHSSSKVYNPDGELVLKGTPKMVKGIQESGFEDLTNFVMTNYSQISLTEHKKTKKDIMMDYCKNSIIIMDESHNATGDSNTKKFLLNLSEVCNNIVFSSATFIKDESQLDLYEKTINFDADTIQLFKRLLANDQELILRKIFTYELTRKLQFWRREHQPLDVGWKTLICDNDVEQEYYIDQYSSIINGLFELTNALSKEPVVESLNLTNSWFSLGATINRLSRNLLLLLKTDTLVKGVKETIARDHKAVVVIDSTFASIINKVIEHQLNEKNGKELSSDVSEEDNDNIEIQDNISQNYELNFKQVLYYIIDEVAGFAIKQYEALIHPSLVEHYEKLKNQAVAFEKLFISPIDMIINQLQKDGIASNEISGRTFRVNSNNQIEKIVKQPKAKLVAEFNSGQKNVIIITRAGASGISLHASAIFKDQRVRDLYELEITSRPTYRLQFMGRVNRKNQVVQPEFFTVITRLPFEQRILNVEQQKLKTLQSHISGDDEKLDQENIYNFYTRYCDECAFSFLKNHSFLAYQMGISLKGQKDDFYYIDSILKRCIVLNSEQQNFLYDYLIYCTQCEQLLKIRKTMPDSIKMESLKTFWHQLDKNQQQGFSEQYGKLPQYSINQFKFAWVGLMKSICSYHTKHIFSLNLKHELQKNMEFQPQHQEFLKKSLGHYFGSKDYDKNFVSSHISPLINNLQLGKCISIKTIEGNIFGYVHNITYPKISKAWQYDNLCLIHIKTINPHMHESIFYAQEDYYMTLHEFVESENIIIYPQAIDWNKFDRPARAYQRHNYCWVGHPVYMEFLRQSYRIGEVRYFEIGDRKNMCIMLPSGLSEQQLMALKKPVYQANKIMEGLIVKSIKKLSTVWQDENVIKPTLKLEPTTGGYNLFIAQEIAKDKDIIDFPLKKKLKNNMGISKGYQMYMIPFKEVRIILLMLEKREVIWFID